VSLNSTITSSSSANTRAIERIRVEMLSTEMPIHQLAKSGSAEIRIMRRPPGGGQVNVYWKVEPNPAVGHPGPLAYRLDTWVIKRRLDQMPRPIPRLVRIGDLRQIARDLDCGGDTNSVKHAFEQNASAFIRAKLAYKNAEGREEWFEGYFNRYNVFFRGQSLPGGARAETVYLSLNDPYHALMNGSIWRPLDFAYLRTLTPSAQRWYELLSPKMFAAIKNGHPAAWIRYSDFCTLATARPQSTKQRMQSQMAVIHRSHLASGYLSSVSWRNERSEDGKPDWTIYYVPGPKAREEFATFNGPRVRAVASSRPRREELVTKVVRREASPRGTDGEEPTPESRLARRFQERRHGSIGLVTPTQRLRAREILRALDDDFDAAAAAIDLATEAASRSPRGYPQHLGGVLEGGFVDQARAHQSKQRERAVAERTQLRSEAERKEYESWCVRRAEARIATLSVEERDQLVTDRLPKVISQFRFYLDQRHWDINRVREWASPRILSRYGHEEQPSLDEWKQARECEPNDSGGPAKALQ
jgi:hypothetical protein